VAEGERAHGISGTRVWPKEADAFATDLPCRVPFGVQDVNLTSMLLVGRTCSGAMLNDSTSMPSHTACRVLIDFKRELYIGLVIVYGILCLPLAGLYRLDAVRFQRSRLSLHHLQHRRLHRHGLAEHLCTLYHAAGRSHRDSLRAGEIRGAGTCVGEETVASVQGEKKGSRSRYGATTRWPSA